MRKSASAPDKTRHRTANSKNGGVIRFACRHFSLHVLITLPPHPHPTTSLNWISSRRGRVIAMQILFPSFFMLKPELVCSCWRETTPYIKYSNNTMDCTIQYTVQYNYSTINNEKHLDGSAISKAHTHTGMWRLNYRPLWWQLTGLY